MKTYRAELHIHTVLSPCGDVEMIPPLIVETALNHGINLIAITDHNAGDNVPAVIKAAEGLDLVVLPGMELQTQEDVHTLCLFDTIDQLNTFQSLVDANLPDIKNNVDYFGEQFVVDHSGEFIRRKEQLLINSTRLSFERAFQAVTDLGGLFIPAHVNRQVFGLLYHLGFVPPDLAIEALELSRHITPDQARLEFPQIHGYPLIQSGDVHYLDDFLGVNQFIIEEPTIAEIKMALKGEKGRQFSIRTRF
ncbi:MAG: PHP domain-containing protein [Brevefilum sp.]|nr:PHP domain-containing protein [Brevefilum sp.]